MKIYLTDQTENFEALLMELINKPTMMFDRDKLSRKSTAISIKTEKSFEQIDLGFLFNYSVFPPSIMSFMTQWEYEGRKMKTGDTILQQAFVPPTRALSQKIVFGVRIKEMVDESTRKGFSYETIEGHVERGESIFTLEKLEQGMIFKIQTYSEPGNWLAKLLKPVFTVPYQTYCTQRALENVKRQIEQQ